MSKNIEINILDSSGSYEVLYPKTLGSLVDGKVSSADSATQLAISRTIQTNLGSTSSASFNGTANVTPGISGTLAVSNGGTGVTSYSSLASQLSSYLKGQVIISKIQVKTTANFSAITIPAYSGYIIQWFFVQGYYSTTNSNMGEIKGIYDFIPVAPNESSATIDTYSWGYWSVRTSNPYVSYGTINKAPYFQSSTNRIFGVDQVIDISKALPYNFILFYIKN